MRFLIDENVPLLVAKALRSLGHDCFVVAESAAQSVDPDVMEIARQDDRVLVTFDSDFPRLIFHELKPAPIGVVYMRSRPEHAKLVSETFLALFRDGVIDPISNFVTIEMGGIVRTMPLEQNHG